MEQLAISFLVQEGGILQAEDPSALKKLGFAPGVTVVLATVPHRDMRLWTLVQSGLSLTGGGGSSGTPALPAKTPLERFRLKLTRSS